MKWEVSDISNGKYLGVIEFQDNSNEWHNFLIMETDTRLVFGGSTNIGFLESGYMNLDKDFSIDENLQELIADLECFYNEGEAYCSGIICNDRM